MVFEMATKSPASRKQIRIKQEADFTLKEVTSIFQY